MPFTFSHPAIVLPLANRKWVSLTGLIVGSIVPDFEYFLRMKVLSNFSHTLTGLLLFDLPFGILLAICFHRIVRNNLFVNLPDFLRSRFSKFEAFNWNSYFKNNWPIFVLSLLIGAASHLFWDAFTHDDGYFVMKIPILWGKIELFGIVWPGYKIAQHLSTLIGGLIVIYAIIKMPTNAKSYPKQNLMYWVLFVLITILIITIRFIDGIDFNRIGDFLVTGMSATMISLIITSIVMKKAIKRRNASHSGL